VDGGQPAAVLHDHMLAAFMHAITLLAMHEPLLSSEVAVVLHFLQKDTIASPANLLPASARAMR
jgi:hypothetical protein